MKAPGFALAAAVLLVHLTPAISKAGPRTDADERVVARVCKSTAPVLVIDSFPGDPTDAPILDLDGNGSYDVYHGEFVSRLIEINGQRTIPVTISSPVYPEQLLQVLTSYADKIEKGELKLAWINFSQGAAFTIDEDLNGLLGTHHEITYNNVHLYAARILEAISASHPEHKVKELINVFLRLQKLGVPIVAAGANSGYKEINIYSLFPNVISVGALDLEGRKADYSADNSAITLWRTGSIKSYAVSGGIALNGDRTADFKLDVQPIPQTLLDELRGKLASEIAVSIPREINTHSDDGSTNFFDLIKKLPKGLYSTRDTLQKALATSFQQAQYMINLGDYFYLDGVHPLPLLFVRTNTDGAIVIDQGVVENGRQFRNVLYGTSFAAPSICDGERTPDAYAL